jgi:hypothetical protein
MKRILALTLVTLTFQAVSSLAGETMASSKEIVAPAPPPPSSYYRANEWSLGAFGTYDASFGNRRAIGDHAWGGGLALDYFPWLYIGFGLEGSLVNTIPKDRVAHQVDGNLILRYPLDLMIPNFHLAPYGYAGVGGLFEHISGDRHGRVLGNFGGGLEYRFTPHIGIFSEAGYELVDDAKNNFMQVNFGLKYAF